MTPEQVLSIKPKILTQKQREFYFENGYILLEKLLPDSWIERLRKATDEMVDKSRSDHQVGRHLGHRQGPHAREPAPAPALQHERSPPDLLGIRLGRELAAARCDRRPRRPGRQVPPLQAQLQMVEGRRRGEVAPGHLVLAAHQLQPVHGRHLRLRLRRPSRARWACCPAATTARWSTSTTTRASGSAASSPRTPPPST